MSGSTSGFRINLDPQLFLNRVEYDSYLRGLASTTTSFVSVKDIQGLRSGGTGRLNLQVLGDESLIKILRSAKSKRGKMAYDEALIRATHIEHDYAFAHQSFAQASKLQGLEELENMLRGLTPFSIPGLPPLVFRYNTSGNTFTAFYVPPIVEVIPSSSFGVVMEEVRKRVESGDEFNFDVDEGRQKKSMEELLDNARRILKQTERVPIVVDGTHRALLSYTRKVEYSAVLIHRSKRFASSIPVHLSDVTFTRSKPRREDGYPGHNEQAEMEGAG